MIKINLQFFGGRGASSDGPSLGGGGGGNVNIVDEQNVWSYRHNPNNEDYVDAINEGVRKIDEDFPGVMADTVTSVNATTFGGSDKTNTLGVYSPSDKSVGINTNYTNIEKMNAVYDAAVDKKYHPSRGNLTGTEAVALHEMGHALTDNLASKMGEKSLDSAAKKIVDKAYKTSKGKGGTLAWAKTISGYAADSNAECIAEAVSDWYCNGNKASSASKAIITEMKRINSL